MVIIKCPNCKNAVFNEAEVCPNCGLRVSKYLERKNNIYNLAVGKFSSESFEVVEEAKKLFLSIRGWKDADIYLEKCEARIEELKKKEDVQFNKKKPYIKIVIGILLMGVITAGYKHYEETMMPFKKNDEEAMMMEAGNYTDAVDLLVDNDFDNNGEKLKEYYLQLGYQELSKAEYDKAIYYFELIDYKGEGYQEIYYQKGIEAYEFLDFNKATEYFNMVVKYKDSEEWLLKVESMSSQLESISDKDKELMEGWWYKSFGDYQGGRIIIINTIGKTRAWTGWDRSYTLDTVKEIYRDFLKQPYPYYQYDQIVNNGNGTYSVLSSDTAGNKIRLFTFKVSAEALEIVSVFYDTWEKNIGIYQKISE